MKTQAQKLAIVLKNGTLSKVPSNKLDDVELAAARMGYSVWIFVPYNDTELDSIKQTSNNPFTLVDLVYTYF